MNYSVHKKTRRVSGDMIWALRAGYQKFPMHLGKPAHLTHRDEHIYYQKIKKHPFCPTVFIFGKGNAKMKIKSLKHF